MMEFNFRLIGKIPWYQRVVLTRKIKRFTEEEWKWFAMRQKIFKAHSKTYTIPILMDEFLENPRTKWYSCFEKFLHYLNKNLSKTYGPGSIERCILVKLPAGASIEKHIDSGIFLERTKRIHIPLITNSKVLFSVGKEERFLPAGELWEINNTNKVHGVTNNGNKDRIHMIVDFLPY